MEESIAPRWLEWAREIQALAQTGVHYSQNEFDKQRYSRLLQIASEITRGYVSISTEVLAGIFNAQSGYATPRIDVRGAVFKDGKLLMVREVMDGGWTMPGGWADVGDIPSEAAEREVWEEAGFRVKARHLIGVYDANRTGPLEFFHAYKLVFLCDLLDGSPTPSNETSEVSFFGPGEIPSVLSGERTKPRHIRDAFTALADPHKPTVFD